MTCSYDDLDQALTRKLQLGPSGPKWESKRSEHACISMAKCSWGFCGGRGGALSPLPPAGFLGG